MDTVIVVTAPEAMRIQRVMQRDHTSESQVRARMDKQWPEEEKSAEPIFLYTMTANKALSLKCSVFIKHSRIIKRSNHGRQQIRGHAKGSSLK
ncbi:MAG: dephospho-CoA kinase [Saprospiraceae bacterium]